MFGTRTVQFLGFTFVDEFQKYRQLVDKDYVFAKDEECDVSTILKHIASASGYKASGVVDVIEEKSNSRGAQEEPVV
jgi:hypothetical protein